MGAGSSSKEIPFVELQKPLDASDLESYEDAKNEVVRLRLLMAKAAGAAKPTETISQESETYGSWSILFAGDAAAGDQAVNLHATLAEAQLLGPIKCCRFALLGLRTNETSTAASKEDGCRVYWLEQFEDLSEYEKHKRANVASPNDNNTMMPFGMGDLTQHLGDTQGAPPCIWP
jgi:hypothetical protein